MAADAAARGLAGIAVTVGRGAGAGTSAGGASRRGAERAGRLPFHRGNIVTLERHPAAPDPADPAAIRRWIASAKGPTAIDVFCGAGGLSLGLKWAGFNVLVGADADPLAVDTHVANLGGLGYVGDLGCPDAFLHQLERWGIGRVDLVAAGLPCQPFSRAGRSKIRSLVRDGVRDVDDPRVRMWQSFARIVRALRPRAVLLENVPDLAVWDEGAVVIALAESLRSLGYRTEMRVLNAFDHGVPQHRRRLLIVGLADSGAEFRWPGARREMVTLRDAIGDLPRVRAAHRVERMRYGGPTTTFQRRMRRGVGRGDRDVVHDHITRAVRLDDAEAFALMRQGEKYADLPSRLQRYGTENFDDKYTRLSWRALSRSITAHIAKDGYWYIHPGQNRTLSIREAARLQTFPDWFRFAGAPSHRYRQIGNAVPPMLAEAIGRRVFASLTRGEVRRAQAPNESFRAALLHWHARHARTFPWRDGVTPWQVLLAEMCLRRTRADQVAPVYRRLMRVARTASEAVRNAPAVRREMRSLGLHWRARNLAALARAVVKRRGRIPRDDLELRRLPGVGDYVAGAVRTFAFGQRAALIDTNTTRVVRRVLGSPSAGAWQQRLDLYRLAGRDGLDARFNYALLDLGALICKARDPLCGECPVRATCASFARGREVAAAGR